MSDVCVLFPSREYFDSIAIIRTEPEGSDILLWFYVIDVKGDVPPVSTGGE